MVRWKAWAHVRLLLMQTELMNLCSTSKLWFEAKSLYVAPSHPPGWSRTGPVMSCLSLILKKISGLPVSPKIVTGSASTCQSGYLHHSRMPTILWMRKSEDIKSPGYDLQVAESLCARCQMPVVSDWGWNFTWGGYRSYVGSKCKHISSVNGCQRHTLFTFGLTEVPQCFNNESSCDTWSAVGRRSQNLHLRNTCRAGSGGNTNRKGNK